jgi:hypothetical protein
MIFGDLIGAIGIQENGADPEWQEDNTWAKRHVHQCPWVWADIGIFDACTLEVNLKDGTQKSTQAEGGQEENSK